jgi:hypothetical protein
MEITWVCEASMYGNTTTLARRNKSSPLFVGDELVVNRPGQLTIYFGEL